MNLFHRCLPDSSRFWPAEDWKPGTEQRVLTSNMSEITRNLADGEWDKEYPGPAMPQEVVESTLKRYEEALQLLIS